MVDPNSDTGASGPLPSPQQIDAIIMKKKMPVNPNDGFGPPEIDISSFSLPFSLVTDPIEPISTINFGVSGGNYILNGGGYTDPARPEFAPEPPDPSGIVGGTGPDPYA
jgi:hypothetical protein